MPGTGIRTVAAAGILAVAAASGLADDLADARRLVDDGLFARALPALAKAAADDPASAEKALLLGRCLVGLERPLEVAKALEAARARNPDDSGLALLAGNASFQAAQVRGAGPADAALPLASLAKAAEAADAVLAKDPKNPDARILKARCLAARIETDPKEVQKALEAIAADNPKSVAAQVEVGRFWLVAAEQDRKNKELWAAVEKCFQAALALDGRCGEAALAVARAHYRLEPARKGLRGEFENAVLLMPGSRDPLAALVSTYQRPDKVVPMLDGLLEKRPGDAAILLAKASVLAGDGKGDRAAAVVKELLAARPQDPRTTLDAGFVLFTAGKTEDGIARILGAVDLCGGVLDRRVYDGADLAAVRGAALAPEQRDRIWAALFKAWPKEPNAPGNAEVWWRDSGGDYGRSLEWCRRGLEVDPADPAILSDMGLIHAFEGPLNNPVKAEEYYRKAVEAAESRSLNDMERSLGYRNAVDNLVKLLLKQKRPRDVLEFAEKHLKADPRYEAVKRAATTSEPAPEK
jgi:hypothetical protein